MALSNVKLQAMCGAGLSRLWSYETPDALATVIASGYFNQRALELKQFDIIFLITSTGGTAALTAVTVTSATGAQPVTVANFT